MQSRTRTTHRTAARRRGFTLVELLVVIGLIMTLITLTVVSVDFAFDDERVSGVSRQLQAYVEGARDRALRSREVRGVRLVVTDNPVDATDPSGRMVTAAFYIQQTRWTSTKEDPSDAVLVIRYGNGFNQSLVMHNDGLMWRILKLKRAMPDPANGSDFNMRVRFGEDHRWTAARWINDNEWTDFTDWLSNLPAEYRASIPPAVLNNPGNFRLQTLKLATATPVIERPTLPTQPRVAKQFSAYEIDLPPTISPNEKPLIFPTNVCIDLDASQVPATWRPLTGMPTGISEDANANGVLDSGEDTNGNGRLDDGVYSRTMDILFDPTGAMTGVTAVQGWIHLCVAERGEVLELAGDNGSGSQFRIPVNADAPVVLMPSDNLRESLGDQAGERKLVSISPGTGRVLTSFPDTTESPLDANFAGNAFDYAEGGR